MSRFLLSIFSILITTLSFAQDKNPSFNLKEDHYIKIFNGQVSTKIMAGTKVIVLEKKSTPNSQRIKVQLSSPPYKDQIAWIDISKKSIDYKIPDPFEKPVPEKKEKEQDIWNKIYKGELLIDPVPNFDVSKITVLNPKDKNDKTTISRDLSQLIKIPSLVNQVDRFDFCGKFDQPEQNALDSKNLPSTPCKLLKQDSNNWEQSKMLKCFDYLRKKVHPEEISSQANSSSKASYAKVIKNLFKLEPEEREFMGMVLTSYGEGRSQSNEEVFLIMKSLENRAEIAKKNCSNADILDVVLQPKQYSMWNYSRKTTNKKTGKVYRTLENWKKTISLKEEERGEKDQLNRMIGNYIKYKNDKFKVSSVDKKKVENLTHYRTRAMGNVNWGPTSDSIRSIKINNKELGKLNSKSGLGTTNIAHYFFEQAPKRGYSFVPHQYRKEVRSCF